MASSSNPNSHIASSTNLFRRLAWQSSISLDIRLADGEPGAGNGCDRYFIQVPRYTYLPLMIPEIRENLVELALDDQQLADTDESQWWFEEEIVEGGFTGPGPCRWHWPLDLIHLYSQINAPIALSKSKPQLPDISRPESSAPDNRLPSPASSSTHQQPLKLLLHLSNPPVDKLLLKNDIEGCKFQWLNQLKEADFVRYRNVSRVTGLRKADLDAGWDGILQDDYDMYNRMASRIVPLPIPPPQNQGPPGSSAMSPNPSRNSNSEGVSTPGNKPPDSMYAVKSLPVRIYLPDNAPVIQDIVPPIGLSGKPTTIISLLRTHLPLLFPLETPTPYVMAIPLVQGIEVPPESEMAWLAGCMTGADGWVRIGIRLIG